MSVSGVSGTSNSALTGSRQTIAENFDTFLTLLTTQLKNQNPLDPLDTNQFTQQLVQFTSVEQELKTNEFLEALVMNTQNANSSQAVSYIGKTVSASGVTSQLSNGEATWVFDLDKDAEVSVTIKDENGKVVYTEEGSLPAGQGAFTWDGIGSDGAAQPEGTYSISIDARDANGGIVPATTQTTGVVTGVDFSGGAPVLVIGAARVNLADVISVSSGTSSTTP